MRLYTPAGDLPIRLSAFPDGQPHVEIQAVPEHGTVTIEAAIRNPLELMQVLLARDVLRSMGKAANLDIRYLMGARMDRAMGPGNPQTLMVIAQTIATAGFRQIRVLDPHSWTATHLLGARAVYPMRAISTVLSHYNPDDTWVLAPDQGSTDRVLTMTKGTTFGVLQGKKKRDPNTGQLGGFAIEVTPELRGKTVLIIDDICDGGATFIGLSAILRKQGVSAVDLFVTHGIFSKGLPLDGIRAIWSTDSYRSDAPAKILPVRMQDEV